MLAYYLYTNVLRTKNIILKLLQLKFSNWFGHDISYHIGSSTILNDYLAGILRAANEMLSNINMFRSPLVDWVLGQSDCTLVVLKNQNRATYFTPMSFIIWVRYIPSWTAAARVIYSASHDDRATVGRFLDFQEIRGPALFKLKQYPLILCLSSVDDAQSASL